MKKTQIGWIFIVLVAIVGLMTFIQPLGESTRILYGIMFLILVNFYCLTVKVDQNSVGFSFGIGIIQKKYLFSDIEYCKPISYMPMGFGIRYRPTAILYNVAGYKAIELQVKGKSRNVWIGTDEPEELAAYINSKRMA